MRKMNYFCTVVFGTFICFVSALYDVKLQFPALSRLKRDAVGSLDIVTNNAQPIHADVKNEHVLSAKPCSKSVINLPSNIEPGVVFKVLPPKESYQSLRKSFPLSTSLDLVRAVSRLVSLVVLAVSAAIEFYPVLWNMYETVYELINYKY